MKQYKVYLFDFDGTLFDTLESSIYVFQEAFKTLNVSLNQEDILFYTRRPIPETYREIVPNYKEEDIEPFLNLITEIVNTNESTKRIKSFDDTYDTMLDLKMAEATLGIVTSNNESHVKDVLRRFDLAFGLFSVIIGNEAEKEAKPSPNGILKAIKALGKTYSQDEIVYVGDAINDCLAAQNAGIDCILLDRNNEYKDSTYPIIHSLKELL